MADDIFDRLIGRHNAAQAALKVADLALKSASEEGHAAAEVYQGECLEAELVAFTDVIGYRLAEAMELRKMTYLAWPVESRYLRFAVSGQGAADDALIFNLTWVIGSWFRNSHSGEGAAWLTNLANLEPQALLTLWLEWVRKRLTVAMVMSLKTLKDMTIARYQVNLGVPLVLKNEHGFWVTCYPHRVADKLQLPCWGATANLEFAIQFGGGLIEVGTEEKPLPEGQRHKLPDAVIQLHL